MKDHQFLHQPLLPSAAGTISGVDTTSLGNSYPIAMSSTRSIIFRLLSVLLIGLISILANQEASKGFDLTIINDAGDTLPGRRFDLLFVSNDKVSRLVLNANNLVQNILHPQENKHKSSIRHLTVHFTSHNLTQIVTVNSNDGHEFVINISSSVMKEPDVFLAMARIIQRVMARIWTWNNKKRSCLIDSMIECIAMLSGTYSGDGDLRSSPEYFSKNWWEEEDVRKVAKILHYCQGRDKVFIGRLNQALRDTVEDPTVGGNDEGWERVEYVCGSCNVTDLSLSNY